MRLLTGVVAQRGLVVPTSLARPWVGARGVRRGLTPLAIEPRQKAKDDCQRGRGRAWRRPSRRHGFFDGRVCFLMHGGPFRTAGASADVIYTSTQDGDKAI